MKSNHLSRTAAFIAIKFYGLTLKNPYRSLFDEEVITFYDRLVSSLPAPLGTYHSALKKEWLRSFFIKSEEWLLPGDLMHILMRKFYIEKMVQRLKEEGYEQLIVPGAGFDHLSTLQSQENMYCFELDSPQMTEFKKEFLKKYGYENNRLHILPFHFGEIPFSNHLKSIPDLSPDKKTIVLAEGFFDYLPEQRVKQLLSTFGSFFNNDLTLISTIFSLDELSIFHRLIFRAGVQLVGEKLMLNHSTTEFLDLIEQQGFRLTNSYSNKEMQREQLNPHNIPLPVLNGFYLIEAVNTKSV